MNWPERPLGELFEVQLGKMLSPKAKAGSNPKPYLRNTNVQWGRINVSDVATMDFLPDEIERFRLRYDDLLICEGGEIGRAAIWKDQLPECYYQKALHRLRPKSQDVEPGFALHFFAFRFKGRNQFIGETGQTTIAHLPKERLERLPFPVPPLSEQRKITAVLSSMDDTIEKTQAVIAQLEIVKKGLHLDLLSRGIPGHHVEFKRSRLGHLIPASWKEYALGDLVTQIRRPVVVDPSAEYREIGVRSHCKGVFHKEPISGASLGTKRVVTVHRIGLVEEETGTR